MTTFEKREQSEEARWSHDKDVQFRARSRRNKLFGLWAAELLGLSAAAAETYAKEVVIADFDRPGDGDVVDKVLRDLKAKGIDMSEHRLQRRMDELLAEARKQVMTDKKG
ncbi:MAG: DUF1476 domain-containing protein [Alphaproteobacteria bacterium]|nr:DUF1476 domain-containing protein [Alphaproteobacteria bacterium]